MFVYVREDSPLRQLHNPTLGGGERADRGGGIVKTGPVTFAVKQSLCFTEQTDETHQALPPQTTALFKIKVREWMRKAELGKVYGCNKAEGTSVATEDRISLFHLCLSLSFTRPPTLSFLSVWWGYPFLSSAPLQIHPSQQCYSFCPPILSISSLSLFFSLSLSLFLPLFMCLLKLSDLLLTPSSSTQPAHSVLWDELWLILSLHPSPPSLVTYLPFCSSLQVSLSPLLS